MEIASPPGSALRRLSALLLLLAVLAGYGRSLFNDFVSFDDNQYVTDNVAVREGLGLRGVRYAFTAVVAANWHPVTVLSHMADVSLYGLNPAGHHLTSLLLHGANTLVALLLLFRLSGCWWRSLAAAFLFAVHPLRVESVAWVAERKDVLSGFFWLLSLLCWLGHVRRPSPGRYLASLALFALGLLSKPMVVTLPLAMLILDWWPLGRVGAGRPGRPDPVVPLAEKVPFLLLSAAMSLVTLWSQTTGGALARASGFSLASRLGNALVSYAVYLRKTFWPADLIVFYPHPGDTLPPWRVALAALLLAVVTLAALRLRRALPGLLAGWGWYGVTLLPVIGIVQVGLQAMADRYTYLPSLGLGIGLAWAGPALVRPRRVTRGMAAVGLLALGLTLTAASFHRTWLWRDTISLFGDVLRKNWNNRVAYNVIGTHLYLQGDLARAEEFFRSALRLRETYDEPHYNLAMVLERRGAKEEALHHFRRAAELRERDDESLFRVGLILQGQGDHAGALEAFDRASGWRPEAFPPHLGAARSLLALGRGEEAVRRLGDFASRHPGDAEAWRELGLLLSHLGRHPEAEGAFRRALARAPDSPFLHYDLGNALDLQERREEAVAAYREALRLDPSFAFAHNNLGVDLAAAGRVEEARRHLEEAVRLRPDYRDAAENLEKLRLLTGPGGGS
jgi:tetratricopeptide (TPR) repeat protein